MFEGGALAVKIAGFGFSEGSFLSASRLSRDGRKNSRKEAPKIPVLPGLNSLPEYTSGTTSKHALSY